MAKKWLIYLVLFLLAANIAIMLSLYVKTSSDEDKKIVMRNDHHFPPRENFEQHLSRELAFNESQRVELQRMSDGFHNERRELREYLNQVRGQYFNLLTEENPDTNQLNKLVREIGTTESNIIRLEYRHYHDIRGICSPDQVTQFDSMGKCRMNQHLKKYGQEKQRCQSGHVRSNKENN